MTKSLMDRPEAAEDPELSDLLEAEAGKRLLPRTTGRPSRYTFISQASAATPTPDLVLYSLQPCPRTVQFP
ncbi:hypothetical protein [Candidatus Palauibacter sp.]|uniref:hypothetical protein n=1 Tax=Candidatus Palauibacter sp. TaxID=3101350 RepID=UPI003B015A95